jgi:hypothetical protein
MGSISPVLDNFTSVAFDCDYTAPGEQGKYVLSHDRKKNISG